MDVRTVKIEQLTFAADNNLLRKGASDKEKAKYDALKLDIQENGLQNLFSVSETADGKYIVQDGNTRLRAIIELIGEGKAHPSFADGTISVQVRGEQDELEILQRSIAGNATITPTKNADYVKALKRLIIGKGYTIRQLAEKVGMSESYVTDLLKLNNLPAHILDALNKSEITLQNCIQLNKLDNEDIEIFFPNAKDLAGDKFAAVVAEHLAEVAKQRRAEKAGKTAEFEPVAHMMKKDDISIKMERARIAFEQDPTPKNEGYLLALREVLGLDDASVEQQRKEYEARQRKAEEDKDRRKKERDAQSTMDAIKKLEASGVKLQLPEGFEEKLAQ